MAHRKITYKDDILPMRQELARRFPGCFKPKGDHDKKPLAIGIRGELVRQVPDLDPELVTITLRSYANGPSYLRSMVEGAPRVDLTGQPVGTVTAKDAAYAEQRLAKVLERIEGYRQKRLSRTPPAAEENST